MGLDTASCASTARKDMSNIFGGRFDIDWSSSRSGKDGGKPEEVRKLHCEKIFEENKQTIAEILD